MTSLPSPPPPQVTFQQQHPAPATPKVDGLAIASMVLGILWLYWIGSVLAIVFAAIAIKRINKSNGWRTGKGMAIAGLVLGLTAVAFLALFMLVFAAGGVTNSDRSSACAAEQKTFETAAEAYFAMTGTEAATTADLIKAGLVMGPGTNYTVSSGTVTAIPDGDC